jgi:polyisoprenoid-binding protein YceI
MRTNNQWFLLALLLGATACDSGTAAGEPAPKATAPTATALASSKSESAKAAPWVLSDSGKASFEMAGKLETIKGTVGKPRGALEVDLSDLTKTRGTVEIDLSTLKTTTFGDEGKDGKQTVDALTWLEVADRIDDAELVKKYRYASFAIRSIESAEPRDVSKGGASRSAKITAKGEMLVHGHKSEHTVKLHVKFTFDGNEPSKLTLTTAAPIELDLEAHEIRPRDTVGKLVGWAGKTVLRDKVAEQAKIALELEATPKG